MYELTWVCTMYVPELAEVRWLLELQASVSHQVLALASRQGGNHCAFSRPVFCLC